MTRRIIYFHVNRFPWWHWQSAEYRIARKNTGFIFYHMGKSCFGAYVRGRENSCFVARKMWNGNGRYLADKSWCAYRHPSAGNPSAKNDNWLKRTAEATNTKLSFKKWDQHFDLYAVKKIISESDTEYINVAFAENVPPVLNDDGYSYWIIQRRSGPAAIPAGWSVLGHEKS